MKPDPGATHDAFISYSHAADGRLAPALLSGLERLAKPWYRRRGLDVYLDRSGLEVTPALWSTIAAALDRSAHLILLLSPDAARSTWVDREVAHWLGTKPAARILLVLTAGEWLWDSVGNDFDRERCTVVPPALHGAFAEEPGYLDLRWANPGTDLDLQHPEFRRAIAQLAAPLHGRARNDLEGEAVVQHRRAVRTAWAAVSTLLALLVAVAVVAWVAASNAAVATQQRDVATSRLLAAQSQAQLDSDPQLGVLLALAAEGSGDPVVGQDAQLRALDHVRQVSGFLPTQPQPIVHTGISSDGALLSTVDREGTTTVWDGASRALRTRWPGGAAQAATFRPGTHTLAVVGAHGVLTHDLDTGQRRTVTEAPARVIAFSADGRRAITGDQNGGLAVWDATTGQLVAELPRLPAVIEDVALSADGRLAAAGAGEGPGESGTSTPVTSCTTTATTRSGIRRASGSARTAACCWTPSARAD